MSLEELGTWLRRLEKRRSEATSKAVEFPSDFRDRHVFVTGRSRAGKSTLVENMAVQDIYDGRSVVFIDPDGDSAKNILRKIPKSRVPDTIYLEPEEYPLPLNFLHVSHPSKKGVVISEIVTIFKRLFSEANSWGDRMDAILRNTVASLLELPNPTLWDIYRLLDDEEFREAVIPQLSPEQQKYWRVEFDGYAGLRPQEPLISRMQKIRHNESLLRMLDTPNAPTVAQLLTAKKSRKPILIVNLVKATDEFQGLLGSLIVNQLRDLMLSRSEMPKERRPYTYLYIDEFQRFYIPSFEALCQQAGKFHLCMILASHQPSLIKDDLRKNIMGIFGSFITFRMSAEDAHIIAKTMGLKDEDLIHLVNTKTTRGAFILTPQGLEFFKSTPPIETEYDHSAEIKRLNKERFAAARAASRSARAATPPAPATAGSSHRSDETVLPSDPPGKKR